MNKAFLDTNVLVSSIDTTRKNHKKALSLIQKIKGEGFSGFISTQIVGEFYVSLTRGSGGMESPLSPKEARDEILQMLSSHIFVVLPITEFISREALNLSFEKEIKGVRFWDVVIVATMLENKISTLYTENARDFREFANLIELRELQDIR